MARSKRLEKKLKAREKEWVERAESLYLKGQAEAFLASVRRRGRDVPPALVAAYTEVRQRILRDSLGAADLKTIRAELSHGRVEGAVGALARAVTCCLDGDLAGARTALHDAGRGEDLYRLDGLRHGLIALVGETGDPDKAELRGLRAPARATITSFRRLQGMATTALDGRGTGRKSLEDPELEACRLMINALVLMRHRSHSPGAGSAAKLEAACARLAELDPQSATVAAVAPRARVLSALIEADKSVRASRGGAVAHAIRALEPVADRLDILGEDPPPAAAAVHFALRRRSRSLLAAVAEAEGSEGLATLVAKMPALAAELTLEGRPVAADEPALEARRLRDPWDRLPPWEFADRVAHLAKRETDPLRVAQLLQIELDGRMSAIELAPRFGQEPGRVARSVLERLHLLANGLKRLPRAVAEETAKLLRADLADLTFAAQAGLEWQRVAEAVLVYMPGDPVLLTLAVAGAHAAGDATAAERLERSIGLATRQARRPKVDRELFLSLIEGLASENVATVEVALGAIRRLVSPPEWQELRPLAAEALARNLFVELVAFEQEHGSNVDAFGETMAEFMAARVADLAPHLGGEPVFEALRVTLACVDAGAADRLLRIDGFLSKHGDFKAALALYRDLMRIEEGFGGSAGLKDLTERVANRALRAIDPGRPREWFPSVMWLLPSLDDQGLALLFEILEREQATSDDPEFLELLHDLAAILADEADALPHRYDEPTAKTPSRRQPRPPRSPDQQLKLF